MLILWAPTLVLLYLEYFLKTFTIFRMSIYRFTRSTANKVNTSNVDKNKLSDLSAKFARFDFTSF